MLTIASASAPANGTVVLTGGLEGFTREEAGYIDIIRGAGERAVFETQSSGGHVSALWQPSEQFSLKLSALVQENEMAGAPYVTVSPGVGDLQLKAARPFGRDGRFVVQGTVKLATGDADSLTGSGASR